MRWRDDNEGQSPTYSISRGGVMAVAWAVVCVGERCDISQLSSSSSFLFSCSPNSPFSFSKKWKFASCPALVPLGLARYQSPTRRTAPRDWLVEMGRGDYDGRAHPAPATRRYCAAKENEGHDGSCYYQHYLRCPACRAIQPVSEHAATDGRERPYVVH